VRDPEKRREGRRRLVRSRRLSANSEARRKEDWGTKPALLTQGGSYWGAGRILGRGAFKRDHGKKGTYALSNEKGGGGERGLELRAAAPGARRWRGSPEKMTILSQKRKDSPSEGRVPKEPGHCKGQRCITKGVHQNLKGSEKRQGRTSTHSARGKKGNHHNCSSRGK